MGDNRDSNQFAKIQNTPDYLDLWKPLEKVLRSACGVADGGYHKTSPLINALRGILSRNEINDLFRLLNFRNKHVHEETVEDLAQAEHFALDCAKLRERLDRLSLEDRERAHNALLGGKTAVSAEQEAWDRLICRLRQVTTKQTPFECIEALSGRVPNGFVDRLHQHRKLWSRIRNGEIVQGGFVADIDATLSELSDPDRLLADRKRENAQREENHARKRWPGAGRLAKKLNGAWQEFEGWFTREGGDFKNFLNSINDVTGESDPLRSALHQIRRLRNQLAHESVANEKAAKELLRLIDLVLFHSDHRKKARAPSKVKSRAQKKSKPKKKKPKRKKKQQKSRHRSSRRTRR